MTTRYPSPLRVLIADPDDVSRTGLDHLLRADDRFVVTGVTAGDASPWPPASHRI